ncbi:PUA-like domain-containing protein [Podospora didyma]|uniref:Thymocyte nuclear protein 1 n=1 Tax=Podospora didyma TaxID=330526 RepID=A0AAE0NQS0_9PEZI|nr:PUA-like domain-containing protein [Podospora didyma]
MPPKRKAAVVEEAAAAKSVPRRSLRQSLSSAAPVLQADEDTAPAKRVPKTSKKASTTAAAPKATQKAKNSETQPEPKDPKIEEQSEPMNLPRSRRREPPAKSQAEVDEDKEAESKAEEPDSEPEEPPAKKSRRQPTLRKSPEIPTKARGKAKTAAAPVTASAKAKAKAAPAESATVTASSDDSEEKNYWLLKAEPESRFENGVDVRFSIDDLAAKKKPEPWDGIRAYAARNNLRAMKKGDLAFFYHSNTKEPGIVGTMEIVQEHSPDLSAHDPKAPYYDPKSKTDDPKWSVVHVEFRSKFAVPIGLKELREFGATGKPLENMQMLKQTRLSVSKVSAAEWAYIMSVAEEKAGSG